MYNPGITISAPGTGSAANSKIDVIDISIDGAKQVIFSVTTPWNTIAPDGGGTEGDIFRWASGNYVLMMKIVTVDETARIATFRLLSFARVSTPYFATTVIGLPASAAHGSILNYTFQVTNNTLSPTSVRWIFGSQESIGTSNFTDWIEPEQLESFPPTTIVRNKNCWYEDWVGGACATGQTIMPSGHIDISGSLTVQAPAGKRENAVLAVFVLVPNFWKNVNSGSPGGDEYVLSSVGGSIVDISILSDPCAGVTCSDICVGNDLYYQTCNPSNGQCVQDTLKEANSPTCIHEIGKGNIYFDSNPQDAEIWLGSSPNTPAIDKGVKTPYTFHNLPPGTYNYILKRFNYVDYIGTVDVVANQIVNVLSPMEPLPDSVYQFTIGLSSLTSANYIIGTINRFADLLNTWILTKISGIILSSVIYDQTNHQIVFEIENVPTLGLGHEFEYESDQNIKSLIAPLLIIAIILAILPIILVLAGWIKDKMWGGPKIVTPTHSSLQITTTILSNEVPVFPIKDVTVEVAGQTLVANVGNSYIVTFANLEIGKTYPIKAYIPLSADSNVNEASFEGTKTIESLTMNTMSVALKIDTLQQRDWKLCDLKLDSNPMPTGTIIRVFRMKTLADGTPVLDTLGTTTSGADQCSGVVKVPAYLLDSQILTQFIPANINPTQPSPTLHPGDQNDIPTIGKEKNILTVITETVLKNNITPDKIDVTDKATGKVIKSIVPSIYTTSITGIPVGTYTILVTKSGYKMSGCSLVPCEFTFAADYLGSTSATIILESLVKTCKLDITVLDTYNKPPKTETYISIDSGIEKIAPAGILSIPEITAGDHKFTVRAEGYKKIDNVTKTISCQTTTDALVFKLEQTEDIVTGSMIMTVNDLKGSVKVDKNTSFAIKVTGGDATKEVQIYNITETPDLLVTTIPAGQTDTTLSYDKDINIQLQAFQGCICTSVGCTLCSSNSNVIALTVGVGEEECLVPGPFGTCLVRKTTGYGLMVLVGLGLLAAIMILRPGGAAERIIERYPAQPPKEEIKAIPPEKRS